MEINEAWQRALKTTEIIRSRVASLQTFHDTRVPYIMLSESTVNMGDTVVRKGEILVEKPSLILPPHVPQFEGFEFDEEDIDVDENSLTNFLLIRGITLPSMRYNNKTTKLDVYDGKLSSAIKYYHNKMQQAENVSTGLLTGSDDVWQFSLLIFICAQIERNTETDIRRLMDDFRRKQE